MAEAVANPTRQWMRVWATLWAPTTDALVIENSDANGSAGIDHLHMEQLVRVQNGVLRFINGR